MSTIMTFVAFKHGNKSYEYGHLSLRRHVIFLLVVITTLSLIKCTSVGFCTTKTLCFVSGYIHTNTHWVMFESTNTFYALKCKVIFKTIYISTACFHPKRGFYSWQLTCLKEEVFFSKCHKFILGRLWSPFLVIKRKMQISWSPHLHFQTEWETDCSS